MATAHGDDGPRGVRGSWAGMGPNMTGTLASRCRLGDNAVLINFLFPGHNDQRQ